MAINMVDRTAASVTIDRAKEADIPVIFFNREPVKEDMNKWEKVFYVGSDPRVAGQMQGELVLAYNEKYPGALDKNQDGKIQYLLLEGEGIHQDALLRTQASIQKLTNELVIENVARETADWLRSTAFTKTSELLKNQVKIELVIANNDAMAIGALEAFESESLTETLPYFVGIDGTDAGRKLAESHKYFDSVINDGVAQAKKIIELSYQIGLDQKNLNNSTVDERYYWVQYKNIIKKL